MPRIDWVEFLKHEFPEGKVVNGINGKELNIDCISNECPKPKGHMFVNMGSESGKHDKRFICHRCGIRGNHKAFLMQYFKLPYLEVLRNFSDLYGKEEDVYDGVETILTVFRDDFSMVLEENEEEGEEGFIIDLPKKYNVLKHRTNFLIKRNISLKLVNKFRIGICKFGFYSGRLIFPIRTGKNRSFVAYSQYSKRALRQWKKLSRRNPDSKSIERRAKKMLNPAGSLHSMLLYNYNKIPKNVDLLFIHEGIMDVIRTVSHNFHAVGLFGKTISEYQARLIDKKSPKETCLMLDGDASKKEINKNIKLLKDTCDTIVSHVKLPADIDPDDIKLKNTFRRIIKNRKFTSFLA